MLKLRSLGILLMLFWIASCTEENLGVTFVTTEEVLFASGDQVRLLGRVISDQDVQVQDHGFYLAEDEAFSSPQIISLGEKSGPGRFIGEVSGLKVGTIYFAKSFMELSGEMIFGNSLELSTLEPAVKSFSPEFAAVGEELIIEGRNFGEDTRVFFGDQEAQVLENTLQSKLLVRVPNPGDEAQVPIRVQVQDREVSSPTLFEYQIGTYELISTYPQEIKLYDNVFFQNGPNEFYIGLGSERRLSFINGFQKFDAASSSWESVQFPGSSRSFAFFTDRYIGGGLSQLGSNPFVFDPTFWKFESGQFIQKPDLPFLTRDALAFEFEEDLYVLGSNANSMPFFSKFNSSTESWEVLPNSPVSFGRNDVSFTYQNKAYLLSTSDASIWTFDFSLQTWEEIASFPGNLGNGRGMARIIGNKAYIGLFERTNELWELDLDTFTWTRKNPMPGLPQSVLVGHFVSGPNIYIIRVPDITLAGQYPMDLYRFDPNGI
ncbi:IPT/TIG domain-containing protein [Algoriphagus limi]|uniref:IPT/TIG domain-containing protein n=1 Tax=Algoriphagus limi TaxID=2975273 RepID=A0ABT2G872_9BACT|nr:IPT/TIG domain-containing protein [Algoriphagus limi]MCS5491441.1 IPT/TIG domain-containing protein [Algoriphagus limi]